MSYSRDLLDSASAFYRVSPETQATLRRAVSTAYYALFHFLIEETCKNWRRPEQRGNLARLFDHRQMQVASSRMAEKFKNAPQGSGEFQLSSVAGAFCELQKRRHEADYDLAQIFSSSDVALDINLAEDAFASWTVIRNEQIAQDYLFSLLFKSRS
jgi:hypothetical protein